MDGFGRDDEEIVRAGHRPEVKHVLDQVMYPHRGGGGGGGRMKKSKG
jgi:hypothetical protein